MVENPKITELLTKHHLENATPEERIQVAVRNLCYCPTYTDMYFIAAGWVPESFDEHTDMINFVKDIQNGDGYKRDPKSLEEALKKLYKEKNIPT
jgi:hypothetical protein